MPIAGGVFAGFVFFYVFTLVVIEKSLADTDDASINPLLDALVVFFKPWYLVSTIAGIYLCYLFGNWFFAWFLFNHA